MTHPERFVAIIILAWLSFFVFLWLFHFGIPGYPVHVRRWDLIKARLRIGKTPRLCINCVKKKKCYRLTLIVPTQNCPQCKKKKNFDVDGGPNIA